MNNNFGNQFMNTFFTHGAMRCVCGERKWILSTITVTHILKIENNTMIRNYRGVFSLFSDKTDQSRGFASRADRPDSPMCDCIDLSKIWLQGRRRRILEHFRDEAMTKRISWKETSLGTGLCVSNCLWGPGGYWLEDQSTLIKYSLNIQ